MLIDFHTHCFPEKIAAKAVEKLSFASSGRNLKRFRNRHTIIVRKYQMPLEDYTRDRILGVITTKPEVPLLMCFVCAS